MWCKFPIQEEGSLSTTCIKGAEEREGWVQGAVSPSVMQDLDIYKTRDKKRETEEKEK
jgi:hypothetical protein